MAKQNINPQQMGPDINSNVPPKPVSLAETKDIPCDNCGNIIFMPGYRFRKVSRLLTGGAKDSVIPIELFLCTNCGKALQEMVPADLKEKNQPQQPQEEAPKSNIITDSKTEQKPAEQPIISKLDGTDFPK